MNKNNVGIDRLFGIYRWVCVCVLCNCMTRLSMMGNQWITLKERKERKDDDIWRYVFSRISIAWFYFSCLNISHTSFSGHGVHYANKLTGDKNKRFLSLLKNHPFKNRWVVLIGKKHYKNQYSYTNRDYVY